MINLAFVVYLGGAAHGIEQNFFGSFISDDLGNQGDQGHGVSWLLIQRQSVDIVTTQRIICRQSTILVSRNPVTS
jgi:hypothetical protein